MKRSRRVSRLIAYNLAAIAALALAVTPRANASSFTLERFSAPTFLCSNNVWTGTVTVSGGFVGTLSIELKENPHQELTGDTTTATFTGGSDPETESYTFSTITHIPGQNHSFLTQAYQAVDSSSNDVTADFGSSLNTKSGSYQCSGPTAATYSRLSVHSAGGMHALRWFSTQHLAGFNVYSGSTRLNRSLVIGHGGTYAFSTRHTLSHLRLAAVQAGGSSL
jgi:hypothetical protein